LTDVSGYAKKSTATPPDCRHSRREHELRTCLHVCRCCTSLPGGHIQHLQQRWCGYVLVGGLRLMLGGQVASGFGDGG
jgi:hypothetical protein